MLVIRKITTDDLFDICVFVLTFLISIEFMQPLTLKTWHQKNFWKITVLGCLMNDSGFFAKDDGETDIAEGYIFSPTAIQKNIYSYPPIGTADGGAFSTVYDLDLFIRSVISGKLLSKTLTNEIFKPQTQIEKKYEWGKVINGFGFHFFYDNNNNLIRIYKEGSNPGVGAMLAYYPSINTTSIILSNLTCDVWYLHWEIEQIILNNS